MASHCNHPDDPKEYRVRSSTPLQGFRHNPSQDVKVAYQCKRKLASDLNRRYNISVAVYEALMEGVGRRCMICKSIEGDGGISTLHIDHSHKTGKIRGVLCRFCNNGIGNFKDEPELLRRSAEYLEDN